ncbi:MAG TPA: barstar family protein [Blastocatellia bacterium]|nr:barstar family protein [Blastocatellia bacterium]
MPEKAQFIIDGRKCVSLAATAEEFTRALRVTSPWHGNLDALNDILNGGFGTPDEGFTLLWEFSATARQGLGHEETAKWLIERRDHCHPTNRHVFEEWLTNAQQGPGRTLFDEIVEIIEDHEDIELRLQ